MTGKATLLLIKGQVHMIRQGSAHFYHTYIQVEAKRCHDTAYA